MARNQETVLCTHGEWTQLTNADATSITFQVTEGIALIRYTTDATAPAYDAGGVRYAGGEGERHAALNTLTSLVGAVRVWARPAGSQTTKVYVDHA